MKFVKRAIYAQAVFFLSVGAYVASKHQNIATGLLDNLALVGFVLLLAWLITPRFRAYSSHDHDAGESFALRAGKLCNRALKRVKGLFATTSAD